MALFILITVLMLEQWRSVSSQHPVYRGVLAWQRGCERLFFAGEASHAWLSYSLAVFVPSALVWLVQQVALQLTASAGLVSFVLDAVYSIVVLYFCLGMRQFSAQFTAVCSALARGKISEAQQRFAAWDQRPVEGWSASQLYHLTVNKGLSEVHVRVLGVLCAWVLGSALGLGVTAAVLYRLAASMQMRQQVKLQLARRHDASLAPHALQTLSSNVWHGLDWLPARATAMTFAVAGSFEDAIAAWRKGAWRTTPDSSHLSTHDTTLVHAVAKGALQWRDSNPLVPEWEEGKGATTQDDNDWEQGHITSLVGLVWRAILMWLMLIALVELAHIWPGVSGSFKTLL